MSHHDQHIPETSFQKPIIIGIILNVIFIVVEIIYGILSNSIALVTDAGHNFSDVIALVLAGLAIWLVKKKSTPKFTYGYKKASVLIALINSTILLVALGAITWEAIQRLYAVKEVNGKIMIIVAAIGIVINGLTALFFFKGKDKDINIKSVFLHMLTDALVSLGVVVSGIVIMYTNAVWIDPVMSILIVAVILYGTWGLLKDALKLALDAVPSDIDSKEVKEYLESFNGVENVHDLHIWAMSTSQCALTVHMVLPEYDHEEEFVSSVNDGLHKKFGIEHTTIQIEKCYPEHALHCDC